MGNSLLRKKLDIRTDDHAANDEAESVGATPVVQIMRACSVDAGRADVCTERGSEQKGIVKPSQTEVERLIAEAALPSNARAPSEARRADDPKPETAHGEVREGSPVLGLAGSPIRLPQVRRSLWEDLVEGAGAVIGVGTGSVVSGLRLARRISVLETRISRIQAATLRKGAIHFSDSQWSLVQAAAASLESLLPIPVPVFTKAINSLRSGRGVFVVESVIVLPAAVIALLAAIEFVLLLIAALVIAIIIVAIIEEIVDAIEEAERNSTICDLMLVTCLENPWQPDWNRKDFGNRKDCGACYRECKHAGGVWPFYKCPG